MDGREKYFLSGKGCRAGREKSQSERSRSRDVPIGSEMSQSVVICPKCPPPPSPRCAAKPVGHVPYFLHATDRWTVPTFGRPRVRNIHSFCNQLPKTHWMYATCRAPSLARSKPAGLTLFPTRDRHVACTNFRETTHRKCERILESTFRCPFNVCDPRGKLAYPYFQNAVTCGGPNARELLQKKKSITL